MKTRRFTPRLIFEDEVRGNVTVDDVLSLYFSPLILRHYHIADICKYDKKFYQVISQDFDKGMMNLKDVTKFVKERH